MRAIWLVAIAALAIAGCANQQGGGMQGATRAPGSAQPQASSDRVVTSANGVRGDIVGTPAPGSKFSRVQIGMPKKQVEDLIGQPTDTASHVTGKAFIPFYFGGDTYMLEAFYRGEGQLSLRAVRIQQHGLSARAHHCGPERTGLRALTATGRLFPSPGRVL